MGFSRQESWSFCHSLLQELMPLSRRRLLKVPWTARRSNQSILKEISPEYSLEKLMLTLKLQYFGYLMWRTNSFEKNLMLGQIEGRRRRGRQRMRWLDGITAQQTWGWASSESWCWTGKPGMLQSMALQRVGHDWAIELNWGIRSQLRIHILRYSAHWPKVRYKFDFRLFSHLGTVENSDTIL